MAKGERDLSRFKLETKLALAGRDTAASSGAVNPPVHHATTLLIDDADELYNTPRQTYALDGMSVQKALCEALIAVEGGVAATLAPSGLAACALALMSVAKAGGELLVTDALYAPTRRFCDTFLKRFGVETRYIDPHVGADIANLITERTCGVFTESPGSVTFEIADLPAISAAAHARGVPVILDNTWSAGIYFSPFEHGVDLSVQALTKYHVGHADAFLGAVIAGAPEWANRVQATFKQLGLHAAPDDSYLVLRGMRTMAVRLERQSASALQIARWLEDRPEVARVLHPALPAHPDHALWRRDFSGASGLFGCVLNPVEPKKLKAMLESCAVFSMGFSWGGYESLVVPTDVNLRRSVSPWRAEGPLLRLSVGLEHPDDLIADLEAAFSRLR